MAKMESILKAEIVRLAKRETRRAFLPLRRELRAVKSKLSGLLKDLGTLQRSLRQPLGRGEAQNLSLEASPEEVKVSRLTPRRIHNLRLKLGLSQRELAHLAKVTVGAVGLWEKGKFRPAPDKKAVLLGLRKLGKREVHKLLSRPKEGEGKRRPNRRKAKR